MSIDYLQIVIQCVFIPENVLIYIFNIRRRSYPARPEPDARAIRFFVRSLGWVEIAEEDLTPERSSRAVNKCIVDLSLGRNDLLDVVGRWGDVSVFVYIFYKYISTHVQKNLF